jgi:hypothetical protein
MGFQRDIGFFGLLQALEVSGRRNLLDRGPGNPRRNFLGRGLIINCRGIEGAAVVSFGGSSSSLQADLSYIQIKDKSGAIEEFE